MRAQSAVEMLILTIVILGMVAIVFAAANYTVYQTIASEKLNRATSTLARTVNEVRSLGPGTRMYAEIDLPPGIKSAVISNNAIVYTRDGLAGASDYWSSVTGNLTGKLPTDEGKHFVIIEMLDNGYARIGKGLSLQPRAITKTVKPGDSDYEQLTIGNFTDETMTGITYTVVAVGSYLSLISTKSSLVANEEDDFNANISIAAGSAAQTASGSIDITTSQGYDDSVNVSIVIPPVLTTLAVYTYSDSGYSQSSSNFTQGDIVYYLVTLRDQTNQTMDASTLDVNITNPSTGNEQQLDNLNTSSGNYQGSFATNTNMSTGNYTISAEALAYETQSSSTVFNLASSGGNDSDCFAFDWSTSSFKNGGKTLADWTIQNTCGSSITITEMTVSMWSTSDTDGALLDGVELNDNSVWSLGNATDGQTLDISDFEIAASTSYSSNNELKFDDKVNDDSEDFRIVFRFSDNSTYTTTVYSP